MEPPRDKTNKMTYATSEYSDQPGYTPSLTRVLAVRLLVAKGPSFFHADSKDSDQTAQADLSLRWAHMPFCWFCHETAHLFYLSRH